MLLVDFQNAFNLVDREVMLQEVRIRCPFISRWVEFCYSSPARLYYGEHTISSCQGAWYLDDDTIIGDTLVVRKVLELIIEDGPCCGLHLNVDKTKVFWPKETLERVTKSIELMDAVAKINDPRLATLPFAFGGLGVHSAGDTLNYAFLASRLESASLQTMLLRHSNIVTFGLAFNDALNTFNSKMEIDRLCNPSEVAAPKLMKKLTYIYFTCVTQTVESTFSLSTRQMALWKSQMEEHASDWLRVVLISGLGQTMNGRTYRCVLCYRLGVPLFSAPKPCSACFRVFAGDICGDHAVSCAGIIGIKHRHNVVRDTLVDIYFRSRISAGKEVDIGLGMVDFVSGRVVIEAAQRKRVKYETKCTDIGYGFLPFSFSSFGELDKDAVALLKRIRRFYVTQDIRARVAIHIFNRISFAIAKGVGAQIVSRLPTNFL
nr:putative reverse transcriptase domain-containing protein [Tanacetum cinerariifolium]